MKKEFTNYLFDNKFIEKFNPGNTEYFRLTTEVSCHFDNDKISILTKEYTPGLEKGGFILMSAKYIDGQRVYNAEEIIFLKNTHDTPSAAYRPDWNEYKKAQELAFKKNLLPFSFHSHPTHSDNILMESFHYNNQQNTSDADKICLHQGIDVGEIKLRLPDILIVGNGRMKSGLFIGFYSGLVAPLDFTERKHQVMTNFFEKTSQQIEEYLDTPLKKKWAIAGGIAAALGGIILLAKNPKAILPTALLTGSLVPMIANASSDENQFYGISHGQPLKIVIPKINNDRVMANEKIILELYEKWKQEQLKKNN
jgi:hypothetical protein